MSTAALAVNQEGGVDNGTGLWLGMFTFSLVVGAATVRWVLPLRFLMLNVDPFVT